MYSLLFRYRLHVLLFYINLNPQLYELSNLITSFWLKQSFAADEKSPTVKLLSSTSEIFKYLISTFEANVTMAMNGFKSTCQSSPVEENKTAQNLKDAMGNSQYSDTYKVAAWTQLSRSYMPILILFIILMLSCYLF